MLKQALAMLLVASAAQAMAQHIGTIGQPQTATPVPSTMRVETDIVGATKVILPSDWKGYAKNGMDLRRPSSVSVFTGEAWTNALWRWLADEGISARLDWTKKRVYLEQVSAPVQRSASSTVPGYKALDSEPTAPGPFAAPAPTPVTTPAVATVPVQAANNWSVLVSDVRLETTLERWAKQAGYTLIWDADRHVLITAEDTFSGKFEDALNRVLTSPAIRDSDYPLEAVFYANNPPVLRITGLGEQTTKE